MTDDHVNFVTIGRAEVSNDRYKVFDIVGKSALRPLATAFVISAARRECPGNDHITQPRTENRTEKNQMAISVRAASGIGNLYVWKEHQRKR